MKKLLFIAIIALSMSVSAQTNADFKEQTIEFIKLTGSASAFEDAINQIGVQVPASKTDAYLKEARGTLDGLYDKLAEIYMQEFTHNEIKELKAFYSTDLGKKLASKQSVLSQKAMMIGQSWGMEVGQIAQKYTN